MPMSPSVLVPHAVQRVTTFSPRSDLRCEAQARQRMVQELPSHPLGHHVVGRSVAGRVAFAPRGGAMAVTGRRSTTPPCALSILAKPKLWSGPLADAAAQQQQTAVLAGRKRPRSVSRGAGAPGPPRIRRRTTCRYAPDRGSWIRSGCPRRRMPNRLIAIAKSWEKLLSVAHSEAMPGSRIRA
jgi:hypothetical protein